jgi:glycerophosphoryl diester phosphodiesterase
VFPDHDEESDALYEELLAICVDGIMTAYPTRYESFLERENVYGPGRPDGVNPCAA